MKGVKHFVVTLICSVMLFCVPATALAQTVYYKESAVYWNYGRNAGVFGFSDCNSQIYTHSSSVNGYSSGWKSPGEMSKAWGYVGSATVQAYWSCIG